MPQDPREPYLRYMKDVLGLDQVVWPASAEESREEWRTHFGTRTGHWPEIKRYPLVFLSLGAKDRSLFDGDSGDLFEKMKAAMKLGEWTYLELECDLAESEEALRRMSALFEIPRAVVFTNEPRLADAPRTFGSVQYVETYGPSMLIEKPELKKRAWLDLQRVMALLSPDSRRV